MRHRFRRNLLRLAAVGVAAAMIAVVIVSAYVAQMSNGLPDIKGLNAAAFHGDTLIYDRNGVLLADVGNGGDHRQYVKFDQISPLLVKATVDVEDRTFWTNQGYDVQSIIRAGLGNVTHTTVQSGASTITQQLAKEYFLGPEQTYTRKVKELLLARELTQTYSKRQIMELYLNLNNYGEEQYGVQAASRTYFGKNAKDLDLAQASLLAGLPQAPFDYDPVLHLQAAKSRQIVVLEAMVRQGDITQEQAHDAYLEKLTVNPPTGNLGGIAPAFVAYVENELQALGYKVGTEQMVVRTTLDANLQQDATNIVKQNLQKNAGLDPGNLNSAAVAMDPTTGQILTYVGSAGEGTPGAKFDYVGGCPIYDHPGACPDVQYVNPGSSVKPYTYGLALQEGKATMNSKINDDPVPFTVTAPNAPPYQVFNFVPTKGYGQQPLKVAFPNSLNISAVKTEIADGLPQLVDFWRGLGLNPRPGGQTPAQAAALPDTVFGPSLTLGGFPITLMQHAAALGTIADLGTYHQPEAILSVTDDNGKVMYQADPNRGMKASAMDPGAAFIVSSILADDNNRALVFGKGTPLHLNDHMAAAKTGTTEDFHDGLTVGWTPHLVSVFWIGDVNGNGPGHQMQGPNTDGVYVAAPAWHQFMEDALKGVNPNDWYQMPADVTRAKDGSYYLTRYSQNIPQLIGDPSPGQNNNNNNNNGQNNNGGPVVIGGGVNNGQANNGGAVNPANPTQGPIPIVGGILGRNGKPPGG